MPTLAGDTYQFATALTCPHTAVIQNVMHFRQQTVPTADVFACGLDLLNKWDAAISVAYGVLYAADTTITMYQTRRVSDTGGPTATKIINAVGTNTGAVIGDSAMSCNIDLIPSEPPWQYGHIYIGPLPDLTIQANEIDVTYLGLLGAFTDLLLAGITTDAAHGTKWYPVIWQRKTKTARSIFGYTLAGKPSPLGRRLKPFA